MGFPFRLEALESSGFTQDQQLQSLGLPCKTTPVSGKPVATLPKTINASQIPKHYNK